VIIGFKIGVFFSIIAILPSFFAHPRQNSRAWVNSRMCIFSV